MTDDPLTRLRRELVDAAERIGTDETPAGAGGPAIRHHGRRRRRATWLTIGVVAIGGPAVAAAAGVLDFSTSGTTPSGSTYTVSRLSDDRASTDPSETDGVGRDCDVVAARDREGNAAGGGIGCRPRGTVDKNPISASFDQLGRRELLIHGTVTAEAARVTIAGLTQDVPLEKTPDGRQSFTATTTIDDHTLVAYDADGNQLGATTVHPGKAG